jgi:hypothetical protein
MRLGKGFILQDDYETTCIKCGIELNMIEVPFQDIPRKVLLHSIHGYDFHVFKCPKCHQKSIQYFEF